MSHTTVSRMSLLHELFRLFGLFFFLSIISSNRTLLPHHSHPHHPEYPPDRTVPSTQRQWSRGLMTLLTPSTRFFDLSIKEMARANDMVKAETRVRIPSVAVDSFLVVIAVVHCSVTKN